MTKGKLENTTEDFYKIITMIPSATQNQMVELIETKSNYRVWIMSESLSLHLSNS